MSGTIQSAQTGAMTVAGGNATIAPVAFGYYPPEGSRAVCAVYDWTSTTGYLDDLSGLSARGVETTIQAVFIDNSSSSQAVTLLVPATQQVLVVAPQSQGAYPLFLTGSPLVQITVPSAVAAQTRVHYLNVPLGGVSQWGTTLASGSSYTGPTGYLVGTTSNTANGAQVYGRAVSAGLAASANTLTPLTLDTNSGLRVTLTQSGSLLGTSSNTSGPALLGGGIYTTTAPSLGNNGGSVLSVDKGGALYVDNDSRLPSFAAAVAFSPASAATDILTINGSVSKLIRIKAVTISFNAPSAGTIGVQFVKRSSSDTGGTSTSITPVNLFSSDVAGQAQARYYTANPSALGTAQGTVEIFFCSTPNNSSAPMQFLYGAAQGTEPIMLANGNETFAVYLEGQTLPTSLACRVAVRWTEE